MTKPQSRVTVEIQLEDDDLGTDADENFVDSIEAAIGQHLSLAPNVGKWDGHEFGGGWAVIYCHGRDGAALSDRLLGAVLPIHADRQLSEFGGTKDSENDFTLVMSRACSSAEKAHS